MALRTSCGHPRQLRLPCANPTCDETTKEDRIPGKVITVKGMKAKWTYSSEDVPEEFLGSVSWVRCKSPIVDPAPGEPEDPDTQTFYWMPILSESGPNVSFRKCFGSWSMLFCPSDGSYLGKVKAYRKGLTMLAGCTICGIKYLPKYNKSTGEIEWYRPDGEYLGANNAIPLLEYPE